MFSSGSVTWESCLVVNWPRMESWVDLARRRGRLRWLKTGPLSKQRTVSSRWWFRVWGEREQRCGTGDCGMLEGCGAPGGTSSGCGGMVGVGGVGRVGAGWASWNWRRVFIISSLKSLRIFWTISSVLNGGGLVLVVFTSVVFTSGGTFGCGGSDGGGACAVVK